MRTVHTRVSGNLLNARGGFDSARYPNQGKIDRAIAREDGTAKCNICGEPALYRMYGGVTRTWIGRCRFHKKMSHF